jgi:hypothetical protein
MGHSVNMHRGPSGVGVAMIQQKANHNLYRNSLVDSWGLSVGSTGWLEVDRCCLAVGSTGTGQLVGTGQWVGTDPLVGMWASRPCEESVMHQQH